MIHSASNIANLTWILVEWQHSEKHFEVKLLIFSRAGAACQKKDRGGGGWLPA